MTYWPHSNPVRPVYERVPGRPRQQDVPADLSRLAHDVAELTAPREVSTTYVAPDKRDPSTAALPKLAARRRGGFSWPTDDRPDLLVHLPLLDQLERLRDGYPMPAASPGRAAPGPRPTGGSDVADLLAEITTGVADLHWQALKQLGGRRAGGRADIATRAALKALTRLAAAVDRPLRDRICRQVHSWLNAARLTLSHTAPMTLLGKVCPLCREQSLMSRSDASGDVFCTTVGCTDDNGQSPRWPRSTWHLLFHPDEPEDDDETEQDQPAAELRQADVNVEAAS